MKKNENITKEINFTNLEKFFESINNKSINLQNLDKVTKNTVLLEGIINAKDRADNSIVEYLVNVEKYDSKSLHYLNNKLNLNLNINNKLKI